MEPIEPYNGFHPFNSLAQDIKLNSKNQPVAVSCHNCYLEGSSAIQSNISLISSAISGQADFIELDILYSSQEQHSPVISHDRNSAPVDFLALIDSQELINADQGLFIEVKGEFISKEQARDLFRTLATPINIFNERAYVNTSRFTFIRSYNFSEILQTLRSVLNEPEFEEVRPFIKLSRLTYVKSKNAMFAEVEETAECGFEMVEFSLQVKSNQITSLANYARTLGLLVNVFSFDEQSLDVEAEGLIDSVDVLTIKPNKSASEQTIFEKAKSIITDS